MTNNRQTNGKYHVKKYCKDAFGFAEHQEKATSGLGFILTKQRKIDYHVLSQRAGTDTQKDASAGRVN